MPDGPVVLARLRQLVEAAREAHLPIIHIRHEEAPGAPVFAADGPGVETMPDVAPQGLEPIVDQALARRVHRHRAERRARPSSACAGS